MSLPSSNVSSCQFFLLLELLDELDELLVADDVHPLGVAGALVAEHQPQAAPDGLLGQDVRLGGVGPQARR